MKLTESDLKKIIKHTLHKVLNEDFNADAQNWRDANMQASNIAAEIANNYVKSGKVSKEVMGLVGQMLMKYFPPVQKPVR